MFNVFLKMSTPMTAIAIITAIATRMLSVISCSGVTACCDVAVGAGVAAADMTVTESSEYEGQYPLVPAKVAVTV